MFFFFQCLHLLTDTSKSIKANATLTHLPLLRVKFRPAVLTKAAIGTPTRNQPLQSISIKERCLRTPPGALCGSALIVSSNFKQSLMKIFCMSSEPYWFWRF